MHFCAPLTNRGTVSYDSTNTTFGRFVKREVLGNPDGAEIVVGLWDTAGTSVKWFVVCCGYCCVVCCCVFVCYVHVVVCCWVLVLLFCGVGGSQGVYVCC